MEKITEPVTAQAVSGESYSQILRSSALVGGSSVLVLLSGSSEQRPLPYCLARPGSGSLEFTDQLQTLFNASPAWE